MYSELANQFLAFSIQHPEGEGDIYDRFKNFLQFVGFSEIDACHETAIWMNRVSSLMD